MPAPANDNFASASALSGSSGFPAAETIDLATTEASEPDLADIHQTIWYVWTAPSSGKCRLLATPAINSSRLATLNIYTGASLGTLVDLEGGAAAFLTGGAGEQVGWLFDAVSGTTYHFRLGIWDVPTVTGTLRLRFEMPSPPANDDFANAHHFSGTSDSVGLIDTAAATTETGEPVPSVMSGGPIEQTSWYDWTAPADLEVTLDLTGSIGASGAHGLPTFDEWILAVWEGVSLPTLVEVGSADLSGGARTLLFSAIAGHTYRIQVGTWGGSNTASVRLALASAPSGGSIEVAFSSDTLEPSPSWVELVGHDGLRVTGWRIDRGRADLFDKTVTGTAGIDIIDLEGVLDPTNAGSLYASEIDPMRQVRIRLQNPVTDDWSHLFKGFASEWLYDMDVSERILNVTLDCSDAFDLIQALEMTPGHHGDTVPAGSEGDIFFDQGPPGVISGVGPSRIHKILDDVGWPAGPREVFTGNVLLQGTIYARRDAALTALFDAADAEFPGVANIYISKSGYVTFHGRYARFDPTNPDYGIRTWQAGDAGVASLDNTVALFSEIKFRRGESDLINAALSLPQGIDAADVPGSLVKDDPSIAKYGWRSGSYDNLLVSKGRTSPATTSFTVNAVDETKLYSEWLVHNYKNPRTRVNQLVFYSREPTDFSGPAIWDLLCNVEIGDIVHLQSSHPGGGGFDEDFYVEGIHYVAETFRDDFPFITLTLDVSPKSLYDFNPFA